MDDRLPGAGYIMRLRRACHCIIPRANCHGNPSANSQPCLYPILEAPAATLKPSPSETFTPSPIESVSPEFWDALKAKMTGGWIGDAMNFNWSCLNWQEKFSEWDFTYAVDGIAIRENIPIPGLEGFVADTAVKAYYYLEEFSKTGSPTFVSGVHAGYTPANRLFHLTIY